MSFFPQWCVKKNPQRSHCGSKDLQSQIPEKWENWVHHLGGAILILLLNIIISTVEAKKNVAVSGGTIRHFQKKMKIKKIAKVNFREMKKDRKKIIYQFWWGPSDSSLKFSPDFKSRGESEWSHPSGIVHHSRKKFRKNILQVWVASFQSKSPVQLLCLLRKIGGLVEVRHPHVLTHLLRKKWRDNCELGFGNLCLWGGYRRWAQKLAPVTPECWLVNLISLITKSSKFKLEDYFPCSD